MVCSGILNRGILGSLNKAKVKRESKLPRIPLFRIPEQTMANHDPF
jgi:hypothetical protein